MHWSLLCSLLRNYEGSNCSKSTLNSMSQIPTVGEEGDSIIIASCMHKPGQSPTTLMSNWCRGRGSLNPFPNEHDWVKQDGEEYKKLCKVDPKFQWKSFPPNHLHFIRSNPMILEVVQELFSWKWSLVNSQQKKNGDRSYGTVWHCSNSLHRVSLPVHYTVQAKDIAALTLYLQRTYFL